MSKGCVITFIFIKFLPLLIFLIQITTRFCFSIYQLDLLSSIFTIPPSTSELLKTQGLQDVVTYFLRRGSMFCIRGINEAILYMWLFPKWF